MSSNRNLLTPFEQSTLAQARSMVINAFATGNQQYISEMLYVFYVSTAKTSIIEECEKFRKETENQITIKKAKYGSTQATKITGMRETQTYLYQRNRELFLKIMLLCEKNNLTEFSNMAKPKYGNRPTA
jgi:hypothetical protein